MSHLRTDNFALWLVLVLQILCGIGMLAHVIYIWLSTCRLSQSMHFMVLLLVLLMIKALALITEASLWLILFDSSDYSFWRFAMTNFADLINWGCT